MAAAKLLFRVWESVQVSDRYGNDVLANDPHRVPDKEHPRAVEAQFGVVIECVESGFCGSVVRVEKAIEGQTVELEDRHGRRRLFVMKPGAFLIDGEPITLIRPRSCAPVRVTRSASGSVLTPDQKAQVALPHRIWVEGIHDAELVEKIWGHDLRGAGVVVEPLHGADDLVAAVDAFGPGPQRRLGILLDHLVAGSKEQRLADEVLRRFPRHIAVVGHPYVDVWQAVRPQAIGIPKWPVVPKSQPWKAGIVAALGWPGTEGEAWQRILRQVSTFRDIEPQMLGRVEELIDFVTVES